MIDGWMQLRNFYSLQRVNYFMLKYFLSLFLSHFSSELVVLVAADVITMFLLALPLHMALWLANKEEKLRAKVIGLTTENVPLLLQEEVLFLRVHSPMLLLPCVASCKFC